jgi:hypothetical protein
LNDSFVCAAKETQDALNRPDGMGKLTFVVDNAVQIGLNVRCQAGPDESAVVVTLRLTKSEA